MRKRGLELFIAKLSRVATNSLKQIENRLIGRCRALLNDVPVAMNSAAYMAPTPEIVGRSWKGYMKGITWKLIHPVGDRQI